jgi:hypothetical protein
VRYARRARLIKQDVTAEMTTASKRRIISYQALYAFGVLLMPLSRQHGLPTADVLPARTHRRAARPGPQLCGSLPR